MTAIIIAGKNYLDSRSRSACFLASLAIFLVGENFKNRRETHENVDEPGESRAQISDNIQVKKSD